MNIVVVLEFGIRKEFVPVILALIAEEAEILFQLLVYMFCLAIRLWMVGSGGVELHSEQLVELTGEIGDAVELPDVPPVQVCSAYGRAGGVGWNEVCSLAIQVHHHHDCIVTMGIRELYNEVHRCYAPLFHRHQ
ncbi:hypothetical protein J132_05167 [Termitomyces sp. J132]|nr:hypothetical protein J132_05167 [Termitomyces sp. J132]